MTRISDGATTRRYDIPVPIDLAALIEAYCEEHGITAAETGRRAFAKLLGCKPAPRKSMLPETRGRKRGK